MTLLSATMEPVKISDKLKYKVTLVFSNYYFWNKIEIIEFDTENQAKDYLLEKTGGGKIVVKTRVDFDEAELVNKPSYSDIVKDQIPFVSPEIIELPKEPPKEPPKELPKNKQEPVELSEPISFCNKYELLESNDYSIPVKKIVNRKKKRKPKKKLKRKK